METARHARQRFMSRAHFERNSSFQKLKENNWNISQTARRGLERSYLYRKMKAYNIEK
jgi:transcriptional regulator of acetoin/glycerol metabolism